MRISALLWDFGDTLVDERWMRRPPSGCATWGDSWAEVMTELADDWNVGAITCAHVFKEMAIRTGLSQRDVEVHARDCCRRIKFHASAWRCARERCRPQALVTVNPDIFVDSVVPSYDLTAVFDVIVVSATEQMADKVKLCDAALDRLGHHGDRSEALLVDNRADLVRSWEAAGGAGYWFQSDNQFGREFPALLGESR